MDRCWTLQAEGNPGKVTRAGNHHAGGTCLYGDERDISHRSSDAELVGPPEDPHQVPAEVTPKSVNQRHTKHLSPSRAAPPLRSTSISPSQDASRPAHPLRGGGGRTLVGGRGGAAACITSMNRFFCPEKSV
ncbi:hypothetical protein E2C01_040543 [Portunus trituberculatus]|uniref:Uncharacterized protein n=1 Tax=Portunus trituberculatus TaxID=210409 RepID=A0A5B7FR25_PORTR|nr:hypothetical protein [Portunus trituberculatus]